MIDKMRSEDLKDPTKLHLVLSEQDDRLEKVEKSIYDDDRGLRTTVKLMAGEHNKLKEKVRKREEKDRKMLEAQSDFRKFIKNTVIGGVLTTSVGAVVAFVLKALGLM
ncbi:hypothetical protein [Mammaliicoccus sciuri]|uniref:hypothetical protein n=1 Tax=Mammaliicoccus sciuri TaxID=1296 RepID=UPI000D1F4E4E|nr:hypothetical protein [Mammaliicoccus sciuri]PTK01370.1 hypothetical protein BUZ87_08275 [Mammaliicoccus sciuri]